MRPAQTDFTSCCAPKTLQVPSTFNKLKHFPEKPRSSTMNSANDLRTVGFPNDTTETDALLCYPPRTSIDNLHLFDCLVMLVRVVYAEGVVMSPQYRELMDGLAEVCPLMKIAWNDFRVDNAREMRISVANSLMENSADKGCPWGHLRSMFYHDSLLPLRESPFLKLFREGREEALEWDCEARSTTLPKLVRRAFLVKDGFSGREVGRFADPEPLFINVWYRPNKESPLPFEKLQVMNVPFNRPWADRSRSRYVLRACISCPKETVRVFSFNFCTVKFRHESHIDGSSLRFDGDLCDACLLVYVWVGDFEVEKRMEDKEVQLFPETSRLIDGASLALRSLVIGAGQNAAALESRPEDLPRPRGETLPSWRWHQCPWGHHPTRPRGPGLSRVSLIPTRSL